MIKQYINQLQKKFFQLSKDYKKIVLYNKGLDFSLEEIEREFNNKFSPELIEFLNWSCVMPIWGKPFVPFVEDGEQFEVWTKRAKTMKIHLDQLLPSQDKKLQIMNGEFINNGNEKKIFKVYVDIEGTYTNKKESIFVEYANPKPNYGDQFEDGAKTTQVIIANNTEEFTKKYLEFLNTIPVPKKVFKKIDKAFEDPKKLYKYVSKYNWDDGEEEMEYIIRSNKCDKATALLVYWLSTPYFYAESDRELKMMPFVIEENIQKNFYRDSENHFDPKNNSGTNFIKEYENSENKKRKLPDFMLNLKV